MLEKIKLHNFSVWPKFLQKLDRFFVDQWILFYFGCSVYVVFLEFFKLSCIKGVFIYFSNSKSNVGKTSQCSWPDISVFAKLSLKCSESFQVFNMFMYPDEAEEFQCNFIWFPDFSDPIESNITHLMYHSCSQLHGMSYCMWLGSIFNLKCIRF